MRFWRKKERYEFEELARYNTERANGLVHTPEKVQRMAEEQARFDAMTSGDGPGRQPT